MARYTLLNLPPSPRVESKAAQGRRTVPLDMTRLSIVGFVHDSYQLAHTEMPVWPVPLLQLDGQPDLTLRHSARFYTIGYNWITKLLRSEVVNDQWNSHATFKDDIHGRAGSIYNEAFDNATRLPKEYDEIRGAKRMKKAGELFMQALDAGIPQTVHDKDAYLLCDGPIAYDQIAFEQAVETAIAHSSLQVELTQ